MRKACLLVLVAIAVFACLPVILMLAAEVLLGLSVVLGF